MPYIDDYVLLTRNTKPCQDFHVWAMLSTLSVFAGRRFWFPFGSMKFWPNLYVVFVGDPGCAKSTAMNISKEIVRASGVVPVAASQITKEALLQKMSSTVDGQAKKKAFEGQRFFDHDGKKKEYNQYAIYATELTQFIGVNPLGFLEFLTAVWDEPMIEVETKNKGCDYVVGPYITLTACMTPDIVKGYLKMNVLSSGFARRTSFVYDSGCNLIPWPDDSPDKLEAAKRCVEFGQRLQKRSGSFSLSPDAKKLYEEWFMQNENSKIDRVPTTKGWFESKGEMLFKVSMLIALAEEVEDLVIEVPHYKMALYYCSLVEKNLSRVFEGIGINPNAAVISQICRMLESYDRPMNYKHILAMFIDNATSISDLKDTIQHLILVGRLAERHLTIDGKLAGTVIGTPSCLARYKDSELAAFLVRAALPQQESGIDPSSPTGQ